MTISGNQFSNCCNFVNMKDNFSTRAAIYAKHRPTYPSSLFDYITKFVQHRKLVWDCGTGNGQSATELSKYFEKVFATDISSKQIEYAKKKNNITYALEPAEKTNLADNSVDLVTISQALHWFKFDEFYAEVKRVSTATGIIAAWTYSLLQVNEITDALIHKYHFETLGEYWDEERKYVDNGYHTIPFPFKQISSPGFHIEVNWGLEELEGYFNTWSALQKFVTANKYNPVPELMEKIKINWPVSEVKKIIFPIHLKLGHVHLRSTQ